MADLHRAFLLPWLFTRSTFILALMEGNEVMSQCYHQAPSQLRWKIFTRSIVELQETVSVLKVNSEYFQGVQQRFISTFKRTNISIYVLTTRSGLLTEILQCTRNDPTVFTAIYICWSQVPSWVVRATAWWMLSLPPGHSQKAQIDDREAMMTTIVKAKARRDVIEKALKM